MIHVYKPGAAVFIKPYPLAPVKELIPGTVRQACIAGEIDNVTYEVRHFVGQELRSNWYAPYELAHQNDVATTQIGFHN